MKSTFPISTVCISLITLLGSMSIAFYLHGSLWSTVSIQELRTYGGLDFKHLFEGEVWRLISAQIVHVKQAHMLFNVVCLVLLGSSLEPVIGRINVLLLWFICGALGLIASVYFDQPPYEVGTGASQAIFGFIAANYIVIYRQYPYPQWLKFVVFAILCVSLLLDLKYAHYPKPGHIVGFLCGLILGYFFVPKK